METSTRVITRIVRNEYRRKNQLDENSRVYLAPHMQKMFVNSPEFIEPLRLDFESTIAYKKIEKNEIQTRLITQEEFDALDPSQKKVSKNLSYIALGICATACIMTIAAISSINSSAIPKEAWVCIGLILIGFTLAGFRVVLNARNAVLKLDSQIAEGNAVLFDRYHNGNTIKFYVMVAFNDQQTYVRSIRCSGREYNKMSIGSKVYVKIKGSSAIAYAAK